MLETPQGPLTESSAIARHLASLSTERALYPQSNDPSDTATALIDAWIDWAVTLDNATKNWIEPMFGQGTHQAAAAEAAKADFEKALQTLEKHLTASTYLVGQSLTLADLVVVSHLLLLYLAVCFLPDDHSHSVRVCFMQHLDALSPVSRRSSQSMASGLLYMTAIWYIANVRSVSSESSPCASIKHADVSLSHLQLLACIIRLMPHWQYQNF